MWIWILLGVAILVIVFYYNRREHMTNDQLISTLKTFGEQGKAPSTSANGPSSKEIYGPGGVPPPVPTNTGAGGGGKTTAGPYPQIFGPDVNTAPGTTSASSGALGDLSRDSYGSVAQGGVQGGVQGALSGSGSSGVQGGVGLNGSGKEISDQPPSFQSHEFNPDLAKAFPVDGPPQPFLTDFSKIQH
jgi:hypothetical protein